MRITTLICLSLTLVAMRTVAAVPLCSDVAKRQSTSPTTELMLPFAYPSASSVEAIESRVLYYRFRELIDDRVLAGKLGKTVLSVTQADFETPKFRALVHDAMVNARVSQLLNSSDGYWNTEGNSVGAVISSAPYQVHPGTPTPVRDPGLPGKGPLVIDPIRNCARPAIDSSDWKPNDAEMLDILWDRRGFQHVGEIVVKDPTGVRVCGFTLVHPSWAITALHCVARQKDGRAQLINEAELSASVQVRFMVMKPEMEQTTMKPCWSDPPGATCPYSIIKVRRIVPATTVWEGDLPSIDLALLEVDPSTTKGLAVAKAKLSLVQPNRVTVAGYGVSTAKDYDTGYGLLVGWHQGGKLIQDGKGYEWSKRDDPNGTLPCFGDSGSSIFAGELYGRPQEEHLLFGVMSAVAYKADAANAEPADKCLIGAARYVVLSGYRHWICENAPVLADCASPTSKGDILP